MAIEVDVAALAQCALAPLPAAADPVLARALWDRVTRLRAAQRKYEADEDADAAGSFDSAIVRAMADAMAAGAPPKMGETHVKAR